MIVRTLIENVSEFPGLEAEHGLSLFIETPGRRILFDTGVSERFAVNADKMRVDLAAVDLAVISHGHYDHGGGLPEFFRLNSKAPVYIGAQAFDGHYANIPGGGHRYVGLDVSLRAEDRFIYVGPYYKIDDGLELFSQVERVRLNPSGNVDLLMKRGDSFCADDFRHEADLLIRENGRSVLISGCSHCGIVNIIEHIRKETGVIPDTVIGGFHLSNPPRGENEDEETVREIGRFLLGTGAKFYTGHCTGAKSYETLKKVMGDRVAYLSTGTVLKL